MQKPRTPSNRNMMNLTVDVVVFLAFLITMAPRFSGNAIHEWLSLAFGAAIVTHLLLHWRWIVDITQRLFSKLNSRTRLNYALNVALFISTTLVIFSGVLVSRSALPLFGIYLTASRGWRTIHSLMADLTLIIVGLHVALHWQWIKGMIGRLWRNTAGSTQLKSKSVVEPIGMRKGN